jgi:hypothetical protein
MEALRTIPAELTQAFESFLRAETDQFAEPPSGISSQLRDYLGAVQHALDSWEGRIARLRRHNEQRERQLAPHRARREQDPSYQIPDIPIPEEFQSAYNWERSFAEMQTLRARILSLIKSHNIRDQFGAFHARNIEAFNAWMTDQGQQAGKQVVLFPRPSELSGMNRRQMIQRLQQVQESLAQFDHQRRNQRIMREEWSIMRGRNPAERTMASPESFMERARRFLVDLNPEHIQPEWLDDGLLAADLRRNRYVVAEDPPAAPQSNPWGVSTE